MIPSRNDVSDALLAEIRKVTEFKTVSDKFVDWDEISAAQRPALFLWQRGDTASWKNEVGMYLVMNHDAIICLTPTKEPTNSPIRQVNALLDALDVVMKPTSGEDQAYGRKTLGGLVYNTRIEGEIIKASGDVSDISVIIVPFKTLVAQTAV